MKKTIVRKHKRKGRTVRRHLRRIKTTKRFRRYKSRKSLDQILNYSSYPKIEEKLGKRKAEALTTARDVKIFFRQYPEYQPQAKGLTIKLLEDRKPSMEIDPEAKFVPGMYIPKKEIRIFPFEPENIPEEYKERAKKFYSSKEQFLAVLPHEIKHHSTFDEDLAEVNKLPISLEEKRLRFNIIQEEKARQAEDIYLDKMRRRQRS